METLFDQPLALGEVRIERKYDPVNPKRDTTVITIQEICPKGGGAGV